MGLRDCQAGGWLLNDDWRRSSVLQLVYTNGLFASQVKLVTVDQQWDVAIVWWIIDGTDVQWNNDIPTVLDPNTFLKIVLKGLAQGNYCYDLRGLLEVTGSGWLEKSCENSRQGMGVQGMGLRRHTLLFPVGGQRAVAVLLCCMARDWGARRASAVPLLGHASPATLPAYTTYLTTRGFPLWTKYYVRTEYYVQRLKHPESLLRLFIDGVSLLQEEVSCAN